MRSGNTKKRRWLKKFHLHYSLKYYEFCWNQCNLKNSFISTNFLLWFCLRFVWICIREAECVCERNISNRERIHLAAHSLRHISFSWYCTGIENVLGCLLNGYSKKQKELPIKNRKDFKGHKSQGKCNLSTLKSSNTPK